MKKIFILFTLLLLLGGCKAKREDYYNLTFEDYSIAVGYDNKESLNDINVNSYTTYLDKKENEIIDYIEIYVKDYDNQEAYLDDYKISSISQTCSDLNGTLVTNNGNTCVLNKLVDDKYNIVEIHGDILSDNPDKVDRIIVSYK